MIILKNLLRQCKQFNFLGDSSKFINDETSVNEKYNAQREIIIKMNKIRLAAQLLYIHYCFSNERSKKSI